MRVKIIKTIDNILPFFNLQIETHKVNQNTEVTGYKYRSINAGLMTIEISSPTPIVPKAAKTPVLSQINSYSSDFFSNSEENLFFQ